MKSERGSTLLQVLLVLTIFSVIGFSLMGIVVGEGKRIDKTESNVQARTLAESGLTYFEADFNQYINKIKSQNKDKSVTINEMIHFFDDKGYIAEEMNKDMDDDERVDVMIGKKIETTSGTIYVSVELPDRSKVYDKSNIDERNIVKVTSTGVENGDQSNQETLFGYYKMDFDVDFKGPTKRLATFESDVEKVDFSDTSVLEVDLSGVLNAEVANLFGSEDKYYPIPDDSYINVGLLKNILLDLDLSGLLDGLSGKVFGQEINRFQTMENNSVIAVRDAEVLNLDLLETDKFNLISLNIINLPEKDSVNVLINGSYRSLGLLNATLLGGYQDIKFKKLGVVGNVIIQKNERVFSNNQIVPDLDNERGFYFNNGLFVGKSLLIGGDKENKSELKLSGNMAVMDNLNMNNVNLQINNSNIYVNDENKIDATEPTVKIENACINSEKKNFHLFSIGEISLEFDKPNCNSIDGLYFSEDSITIDTKGEHVTINGELFGDVIVKGGGSVTVKNDGDYEFYTDVKFKDIALIPQGRSFNDEEN